MTTDPAPFAPLPALRSLGDLADALPVVVIDTREQTPLAPTRLPFVRAGLTTGDYSVQGLEGQFAVERKSIPDLVACCKSGTKAAEGERERFERELQRLSAYCVPGRFGALLIIGTPAEIDAGAYRSEISPKAVWGSLKSWRMRYGIERVFCGSPAAGALWLEDCAWWYARTVTEQANELKRGVKG